jgi:hypothetical protein
MENFELIHPRQPNAMRIARGLNAISFLNQLSKPESARVFKSIERFSSHYDALLASHVRKTRGLKDRTGHDLYTYRAGQDLRVFFYVENQTLYVVDIARRSQLDSIGSLRGNEA